MKPFVARLLKAERGSAIVEMGLLAPLICGLLLGVVQVGFAMQNYNALRGISGDVERFAVVNFQTDNSNLSNSQLTSIARSIAISQPYNLQEDNLTVEVTTAAPQRVAGATELTLTTTYTVDSVLKVIGVPNFDIAFTRSIFLLNS